MSPGRWRCLVFAAIGSVATLCAQAQMSPDAPIEDFRFPMFNDAGYRIWEVRGVQGIYRDAHTSEVIGLDLQIFSGDESSLLTHRIMSPRALIFFDRQAAAGDGTLFLSGPGYTVEGTGWEYDGRSKRLTIQLRSRMSFVGQLTILK